MAAVPKYPDSDFSDEEQSPIDVQFNKATNHVRKITSKLNTNQLLELYGLYKQGTEGNNNTQRPGWLNMQGRQKWDAWNALQDMPLDEAKKKYTELVQKFDPQWTELTDLMNSPKESWASVSTHMYSPEPELNKNEMSVFEAAKENCAERLADLLAKQPDLKDETDEDGLTVLHWAADRNATQALEVGIKTGIAVDALDSSQQSPLHYASQCGHIESVRILLAAGASPLVKDEDGSTPIDVAATDEIRDLLSGS